MPVLHIQLLGDFRLTYDDGSLKAIAHARQQTLLAYLVLHRDAPQSRHHLAFLFWPDTGEAQALTNLRNLLHKLRQELPDPERFLLADAQTIQWRPDAAYTLDVADFVILAQSSIQADLKEAVKLYRGDLLPSCYDEWIVTERERLQQMLLDALGQLVAKLEAAHDYSAAISYAHRLAYYDPLREETYRHLMQLHSLNNDRAAVMHVYHTCATTLQHELGVEPNTTTQQFYERLLNLQPQPLSSRGQPAVIPLVGRDREWALLQSLWLETTTQQTHMVLIKGEAGIGKTRLAEELIEWASRQGISTLTAHCYSAQGQLAYAPLVECLQAQPLHGLDDIWLIELARLLPEIILEHPDLPKPAPFTQNWQRLRLFKAIAHALPKDHLSLLLYLEDIQWCDRDTLDWLHYLLQTQLDSNTPVRLLVIGSLRIEEISLTHPIETLLADLRRADQLTEIELGPLDESATFQLANLVAGQELDPALERLLFQGSEGHPLFVVEMVRAGVAQMEPHGPEHARTMLQTIPTLPLKVRQVITARLGQLSESTQELVGLAATVGRAFTFDVLLHASNEDEDTLVRGLDELWRRRIIRERGSNSYDFSHDKIREVAYTAMSLTRRRLLHQRIAQAMESVYSSRLDSASGQIATHYEMAGRVELAVPYYERAAEVAQRIYANADAIRDYRRAVALLEGPANYSQSSAARLYERLGDVLHWTGQYEEARAAYQQAVLAVPLSESVRQAQLNCKIGNSWRDQHQYQEAFRVYAEAERVLGEFPVEPSLDWWKAWIQVLLETNLLYYWLGNLQASDLLRLRLQPAVEQHGTPDQRAVFFQNIVWIEFRRNRSVATAEMVSMSKNTLAAQQEANNQAGIPSTLFGVGFILLWHGEPRAAVEPLLQALHLAEQTGDVSLQARCLTYLTIAYRQCAQVVETRLYAARNMEVASLARMPEYIAMAKANQAWLAWLAGDPVLAEELGQAALVLWHQLPAGHASAPFQWLARWPMIAVALQQEQFSLAIENSRALLDPGQQRLPDVLVASLEQAINAWDGNIPESAREFLHQSLVLAQQMHYL